VGYESHGLGVHNILLLHLHHTAFNSHFLPTLLCCALRLLWCEAKEIEKEKRREEKKVYLSGRKMRSWQRHVIWYLFVWF